LLNISFTVVNVRRRINIKNDIETKTVSTRITKPMHKAVLKILSINAHVNVADYVRDLIRKDLEKRGVNFDGEKGDVHE